MLIRDAVIGTMLLALPAAAQPNFDQCGEIVAGAECALFRADGGGRYVVADLGNFEVGDRVQVLGELNENCATTCQEGDGCVTAVRVTYCDEAIAACGKLVQGVECALFEDDRGFLLAIDRTDGFAVDDRVHITGRFEASCASICHQQSGCVEVESIVPAADDGTCRAPAGSPLCGGVSLGLASIGLIGFAATPRRRFSASAAFVRAA